MTRERVLTALFEDTPKSSRVIMRETGLSRGSVAMAINRLWRGGRVLRTAEAIFETERIFKGRASARELQHYCIDHDMKLKEVLEKAIQEYLDKNSGGKKK